MSEPRKISVNLADDRMTMMVDRMTMMVDRMTEATMIGSIQAECTTITGGTAIPVGINCIRDKDPCKSVAEGLVLLGTRD